MASTKPSDRIQQLVDALPLMPGMRVLEIGCGPGAAARAVIARIRKGHVLAIDRSATAIAQARKACAQELADGRLSLMATAVEDLELPRGTKPFDLAFAFRVGALDGRHLGLETRALERIRTALKKGGPLYIDSGTTVTKKAL